MINGILIGDYDYFNFTVQHDFKCLIIFKLIDYVYN